MAKLTSLKPILYTKQILETIEFYTNVLDFTCVAYEQEGGWASIIKDGIEIMFAYPNEHMPFEEAVFTGSFYITTDNVDALWKQWKDKCKVCYPIDDFDYGMREFALYDNNGYLLQFGQPLN